MKRKFFFLVFAILPIIIFSQEAYATVIKTDCDNSANLGNCSVSSIDNTGKVLIDTSAANFGSLTPGSVITSVGVKVLATGNGTSFYSDCDNNVLLGACGVNAANFVGNVYADTSANFFGLAAGGTVTSVGIYITSFTAGDEIRVKVYDTSGNLLGESGADRITATGLQNFTLTAVVPASGHIVPAFEIGNSTTQLANKAEASGVVRSVAHVFGSGPNTMTFGNIFGSAFRYVVNVSNPLPTIRVKVYDPATGNLLGESGTDTITNIGLQNFTLTAVVPASGQVDPAFEVASNTTALATKAEVSGVVRFAGHIFGQGPNNVPLTHINGNAFGFLIREDPTAITLNPSSGLGGTNINVTGFGFGATNNTNIFFDGVLQTTIGHIGTTFSTIIQAPAGSTIGGHTVNATDTTGNPHKTAIATFTINSPTLILNSTNGNVGSTISASGLGFFPAAPISIHYDSNSTIIVTNPMFPPTNSTGGFSNLLFNIPDSVAGHHKVKAQDGNLNNATVVYNVTSSIVLTHNSGNPGLAVGVTGKGFSGSKSITVKFDGVTIPPTIGTTTSDTKGDFSNFYVVPSTNAGSHTFSATDGSHTATASFTTTATILINPSSGNTGTHVTALGTGFSANSALTVAFDGTLISTTPASPKTDHLGQFNNTVFTIPSTTPGSHTITITDASSNSGTATFTVTATTGFSLFYSSLTNNSIILSWLTPSITCSETIQGYQINYTTPHSIPKTIIVNNTGNKNTSFTLSGLSNGTDYSFRVGVWTNGITNKNMTNILDITTLLGQNSGGTIGQLNFTAGINPLSVPFKFVRTDIPPHETDIKVIFPNTFNTSCNLSYAFAMINKTYSNLITNVEPKNQLSATFKFVNSTNDIITISCTDSITKANGKFILTQNTFPMLQQINDFRAGKFGTSGQFGAIDLVTLLVVIISMIGFNRVNEAAGIIFTIMVIGVLAFFQIITWPTIVVAGLAVIVLVAVSSHRKIPGI